MITCNGAGTTRGLRSHSKLMPATRQIASASRRVIDTSSFGMSEAAVTLTTSDAAAGGLAVSGSVAGDAANTSADDARTAAVAAATFSILSAIDGPTR